MPGSHPTAAAATTTTQVAVPATPTATCYSSNISERMPNQELPRPKRAAAQRANVYLYQETFDWNEERALKRAIDASLQAIDSDATGQLDEDCEQPPSSAGADCLEAMANHHNSQRNGSRSGRASAVTAANLNPNNNNNSNNPNSRRKKPNASTASNRSNSFKTNKPIVHSSRLKAGRNGATRARPVKPLPTASKATANSRASTSLSSSQKNGPSRPKKTLNSASVNYKQSNCSTVAVNVASRSGATVNGQLSLDESDSSPSESSCATSSSTSSFSKGDHAPLVNPIPKPLKQGAASHLNHRPRNRNHLQFKSADYRPIGQHTATSTSTKPQPLASLTSPGSDCHSDLVVNRAKLSARRKFATSAGSLEILNNNISNRLKPARVPDSGRKTTATTADPLARMGDLNGSSRRTAARSSSMAYANSGADLEDFELFPNTYINTVEFITFLIHTPTKLLLQPEVDTFVPFTPLPKAVLEDLERRLAKQKNKNNGHVNNCQPARSQQTESTNNNTNGVVLKQLNGQVTAPATPVKPEFGSPSFHSSKPVLNKTLPETRQTVDCLPQAIIDAIEDEPSSDRHDKDGLEKEDSQMEVNGESEEEEEDSDESSESEQEISPVVTRSSSGGIRKRLRAFSNGQKRSNDTRSLRSRPTLTPALPVRKRSMERKAKPSFIAENFFSDTSDLDEEDEEQQRPPSKLSRRNSISSNRNKPVPVPNKIGTRSSSRDERDSTKSTGVTGPSSSATTTTVSTKRKSNSEEIRKSALKYEDRARKSINEIEARYKLNNRNEAASSGDEEEDDKSVASLSTVSSTTTTSSSSSSEPPIRKTSLGSRSTRTSANFDFSSDDDDEEELRNTRSSNPIRKKMTAARSVSLGHQRGSGSGLGTGLRLSGRGSKAANSSFHYIETRSSRRKTRNSKSLHEQRNKELYQQYDDKENRFSVQTSGSQKIAMARPTKSYRRPKAAAKSPLTAVTSPEVPIKRRSAKSRSSKSSADAKSTVQSKSSLVPIAEQSSEPIQTLVMEVTLHENRVPESDLVDSGPSSSSYGYGTSHDLMESGSDSSSDYHHPELEGHYKLDEFGDIDLTHCDPIQEMLLTKNAGKFFALYDNYIIVGIDGYNAFWERVRKLYAEDEPQDSPDTPHSPVNHSQPGPNSPHQSHATQMDDSFSSGDRLFGSVDSDLDTTDLSELI